MKANVAGPVGFMVLRWKRVGAHEEIIFVTSFIQYNSVNYDYDMIMIIIPILQSSFIESNKQ